jgi:hypothetical protein
MKIPRKTVDVDGNQMVFDEAFGRNSVEPELGKLSEHRALVGDRVGKDHVEGGNPVGGDQQKLVLELKDLPDLPAADFANSGKIEFTPCARHRHRALSS